MVVVEALAGTAKAAGRVGLVREETDMAETALHLPEARERYHENYGCMMCGSRSLGCTPERCVVDGTLRDMADIELDSFTNRSRELYNAAAQEIIRRAFVRIEGGT